MTAESFKELKSVLQPLTFDPALDKPVGSIPEAQSYLALYQFPVMEGVQHFLGKFQSLGFDLATNYFLPPSPSGTVFVLHGYFDHQGLFTHLIKFLLEKNLAVVGFDLPGHGLSSGEQVSIESFHHYAHCFSELLVKANKLQQPFHAVGQSTGGAVLMNHLLLRQFLYQPVELEKVVLLAPLVRPSQWGKVRISHNLTGKFRKRVKRKFRVNSSDQAFLDFVESGDPLQSRELSVAWVSAMRQWVHDFSILPQCMHPIRVLQGDLDNTVDWQYNLRVIGKKFPKADIVIKHGVGHHMANESQELRDDIFSDMGF